MSDEVKEYLQPGKKNLILVYVLYLSGLLVPILPIIGAVFAYANKTNDNKIWQSHYLFAFRTFLFGIIGSFVAMITIFIFIGPILYMFIFVWFIVRSIVAMQFLLEGSSHPNPLTFWIK